jgi:hypothetical protein
MCWMKFINKKFVINILVLKIMIFLDVKISIATTVRTLNPKSTKDI